MWQPPSTHLCKVAVHQLSPLPNISAYYPVVASCPTHTNLGKGWDTIYHRMPHFLLKLISCAEFPHAPLDSLLAKISSLCWELMLIIQVTWPSRTLHSRHSVQLVALSWTPAILWPFIPLCRCHFLKRKFSNFPPSNCASLWKSLKICRCWKSEKKKL